MPSQYRTNALLYEMLKKEPASPEHIVLHLQGKLSRKTIYKALTNLTKKGYVVKYIVGSINSPNQNEPRVMYGLQQSSGEVPSEIDFLNAVWKPLIHRTSRKEQRLLRKLRAHFRKRYIDNVINGEPITDKKTCDAFVQIANYVYYTENEQLDRKVAELDEQYLAENICLECFAKGIVKVRNKENVCPNCGVEGPPKLNLQDLSGRAREKPEKD